MPADRTPAQRRLLARLVTLADLAEVSGSAMAKALGVSQSTASRIWNGRRLPTKREVQVWLDTVQASDEVRDEVWTLLDAAALSGLSWAEEDVTELQNREAETIRSARLVCSYQQSIVPGLLQTARYARRVLEDDPAVDDVPAHLAARMRAQETLYEGSGRVYRFVIAEHVLNRDLGDPEGMAAQRDRLASVSTLDTVELLVLPEEWAMRGPMVPFTLYDQGDDGGLVRVELPHGAVTVSGADDVEVYRRTFSQLAERARPW